MSLFSSVYDHIWVVDYEFHATSGDRPEPLCVVAHDLCTDRTVQLWRDEMLTLKQPPYGTDERSLFVAYYASAELGCHLVLGWPLPVRILDAYVEFKWLTCGRKVKNGHGLLGALAYFGLPSIEGAAKDAMRDLAMRGGPYTSEERADLIKYCSTDVEALARLLCVMASHLDLPHALLRGRYMAAAARMEHVGTPIDTHTLTKCRRGWEGIKAKLIAEVDSAYGVFAGSTFKTERFAAYLVEHDISWPRHPTGALDLSDATFRQMAKMHPEMASLRELRYSLSQLRLADLAVGQDGRNRCMLSAFQSKTGRNQPSNSKFIFGPSVWLRGLIKPERGRAVAYVDWSQQEFGIAAALSGDARMQEAYSSGDPYLRFAVQAGSAPDGATKKSHPREREQFKICALAVQYGMGRTSLAASLGQPGIVAHRLLQLHRETYPRFWAWDDAAVDHAMLFNWIETVFGWRLLIGRDSNPRSVINFPMQSHGSELLRLACCLATERGINVCAPVHDAVLIEAPTSEIKTAVEATQAAMAEASEVVLDGFRLRTDAEIVTWPDRYMDERGRKMWDTTMGILQDLDSASTCALNDPGGVPEMGQVGGH